MFDFIQNALHSMCAVHFLCREQGVWSAKLIADPYVAPTRKIILGFTCTNAFYPVSWFLGTGASIEG